MATLTTGIVADKATRDLGVPFSGQHEKDTDLWEKATNVTDEHLDAAYTEMAFAAEEVRTLFSDPRSTLADRNSAAKDLFALGMISGSRFTLQRVIGWLGDDTQD